MLRLIKEQIRKRTELQKGVILSSGKAGHYHFIGTERLFTEEQFITFLSLCLWMRDESNNLLVDPRWVGKSLNPMGYLVEGERARGENWSYYDFVRRFAALRISRNEQKPYLPVCN